MSLNFSLRTLFSVISLCGLCALVMRAGDWLATTGFAVASILFVTATKSSMIAASRRVGICIRLCFLSFAVPLAWFAVIDRSTWMEWCGECSEHRFVDEIRLGGIPITGTQFPIHPNLRNKVRVDLGAPPCKHKFEREHLVREWGLLVSARPCIGFTCCLSINPDYYNDGAAQILREYARDNPLDAQILRDQIANEKGYATVNELLSQIKKGEDWIYAEQMDERANWQWFDDEREGIPPG